MAREEDGGRARLAHIGEVAVGVLGGKGQRWAVNPGPSCLMARETRRVEIIRQLWWCRRHQIYFCGFRERRWDRRDELPQVYVDADGQAIYFILELLYTEDRSER